MFTGSHILRKFGIVKKVEFFEMAPVWMLRKCGKC